MGFDSPATSQFYVGIVATVLLLPVVVFFWTWPSTLDGWIAFFAVGTFGFAGHQLVTVAAGLAPGLGAGALRLFPDHLPGSSSRLLFNQPPDIRLYVGAPIVIGSGLYIWLRERKLAKPVPAAPSIDSH
ncbi:hypothetical protein [Paracoccus sp. (in: a-proteobacteria)]|uniref:hypothetical protein n=1 Tax=Paracoccus sp. TaxID=267 RepID=UPI002B003341|nr:hypothetical protein [Paracoccus sp. (in: a-proteobacteria)]